MKTRVLYTQKEHDDDQQLAEAAKKQIDEIRAYYSDVIAITDVITLPEVAGIVMNTRHGPITLGQMCTRNELRAVLRTLGDSPGADPEQVAYFAIKEYRERYAQFEEKQATPVADLELAVRVRLCLLKMGINTLGALAQTTEKTLRDSRNFGETSLNEIKEMLAAHGMALTPPPLTKITRATEHADTAQDKTGTPIEELNLSIRARKGMSKLGIQTVEDLAARTAEELIKCKNFGVTSLNEVREKLLRCGLRLRGDQW